MVGSNLNKWIGWFPPLYFIHDLEEILTIEKFLHSQSTVVPFQINTKEFTLAFLLLFIIAVVGCYFASQQKRFLGMTHTTFFSFLVPGILLANGAGHLLSIHIFQRLCSRSHYFYRHYFSILYNNSTAFIKRAYFDEKEDFCFFSF